MAKTMFFYRSRLVAREFKWLERDKEGLYAPATSSITTKLLPWMLCEMQRRQAAATASSDSAGLEAVGIMSLDVKLYFTRA